MNSPGGIPPPPDSSTRSKVQSHVSGGGKLPAVIAVADCESANRSGGASETT